MLCTGGAKFFLQDNVLDSFGAHALRLCNALFGSFPLHMELSVVFESSLARCVRSFAVDSRCFFCAVATFARAVSSCCVRRVRRRVLRISLSRISTSVCGAELGVVPRLSRLSNGLGVGPQMGAGFMRAMMPGFHSYFSSARFVRGVFCAATGHIVGRAVAILGWQQAVNLIWWTQPTVTRLKIWITR